MRTDWYDRNSQRVVEARNARDRWESAISARMGHADINDRWVSYTRLAALAGPGVLQMLEAEAKQEGRK